MDRTEMGKIELKVVGVQSLLMHNVRLANPHDTYTKQLAKLAQEKRGKGANKEEILLQMQRVEWEGGLYHDAIDGGKNEGLGPYIPARNFHKAILEGASMTKNGTKVKDGLYMGFARAKLEYEGPRDIEGLYAEAARFVDVRVVGLQGAKKLPRCRPVFHEWACSITLAFDPRICGRDQVLEYVEAAGKYKGVCDGHRGVMGMGRFLIEE